jgi:mRNA interferase MazF
MQYEPQQGDIVLLDFDPQTGREQRGTRPALVVSNAAFNRFTNLAMVCPITITDNGFPLHISLDERTRTQGVVLCEQVKSLDLHARNAKRFESVPEDIIEEVADLIAQFVGFPKIR